MLMVAPPPAKATEADRGNTLIVIDLRAKMPGIRRKRRLSGFSPVTSAYSSKHRVAPDIAALCCVF
jgi:hypothetical protein